MTKQIPPALAGVFAALPTPYQVDGTPDVDKLQGILDFHLDQKTPGLCVGGVTGEYATCSVEQRLSLFQTASRYINGRIPLVFGIGGEHFGHVQRLARAAADCGAIATLLPSPSFFKFRSSDLLAFLKKVTADLPLPVLFYNIPQFTSGLSLDDVLSLIDSVPNVIGLKDSSGMPQNLPFLLKAKQSRQMIFFIGSDGLLLDAFENGADGSISGIAGVCPDLIRGIYETFRSGQQGSAKHLQTLLDELIAHIDAFPPPWAIKLALQARGIETGVLSWPLGEHLQSKKEELQAWFMEWLARSEAACGKLLAK
ncbi:MAG TPA: dihydrodipicolinate synthase family protein [Terriglobia bacterium]|nr:dihydrodipicolinate synthase family protein [Terriglobia bacterium]